jgi:hypothetical protein
MPLRWSSQPRAKQLNVRMLPNELKALDAWIKMHPAPRPPRPEAIRRLVELALGGGMPQQKRSKKSASWAREMAGLEIDRLGDTSLTADERELRKRRLIKGPGEFRDMRSNA